MRQAVRLVLAVALAGALAHAQENPPQSKTVPDSINFIWKSVAKDFTRLADAMPEEKWNFKPTQGAFTNARTFAEQVKHVACANEAWAAQILKEKQQPEHSGMPFSASGTLNYHAVFVYVCQGRGCPTYGWHYTVKAGSTVSVSQ